MSFRAPIALFVYNRPNHTHRTLAALASNLQADESDLYIYSDGAKPGAEDRVRKVREIISSVNGFKSVQVVERDHNMGLSKNITDGVTSLCEIYGSAIVLEDDLVTSPQFLEFMNAALVHYSGHEKVMQISGHSFMSATIPARHAMLPVSTSWGWATWARAWQHYESEPSMGYELLCDSNELRKRFDYGGYPYFNILKSYMKGENDSWAVRWYLTMFKRDALTLYPSATLIDNRGLDGSGTHCANVPGNLEEIMFEKIEIGHFPEAVENPQDEVRFKEGLASDPSSYSVSKFLIYLKAPLKKCLVRLGIMKK